MMMKISMSQVAFLAAALCSCDRPISIPKPKTTGKEKAASTANGSERSGLADGMILEEAREKGVSGDSIRMDLDEPSSLVMRLYRIRSGEAETVQESVPTAPLKSFAAGFMFRPSGDGRTVDFIFSSFTTKEQGEILPLAGKQERHILDGEKSPSRFFAMAALRPGQEIVVYSESDGDAGTPPLPIAEMLPKIKNGYLISAALSGGSGEEEEVAE